MTISDALLELMHVVREAAEGCSVCVVFGSASSGCLVMVEAEVGSMAWCTVWQTVARCLSLL
jgi:hypothetical protein